MEEHHYHLVANVKKELSFGDMESSINKEFGGELVEVYPFHDASFRNPSTVNIHFVLNEDAETPEVKARLIECLPKGFEGITLEKASQWEEYIKDRGYRE